MVQSINKPLWPMALVHGALKWWMRESLCSLDLFFCAEFSVDYSLHPQKERCYSKTHSHPMLKKKKKDGSPLDTVDHFVCENGMIQIHSPPGERTLMIKCVACYCALIFGDPLKMHHALKILLSRLCNTSITIIPFLVEPCFSAHCFTCCNCDWNIKEEQGQLNFVVT